MTRLRNPPPGTLYFGFAYADDCRTVAVFPVSRDEDGRLVRGDTFNEFRSHNRAMEEAERLNRIHRESLIDNIRNAPPPGTGVRQPPPPLRPGAGLSLGAR